MYNEMVTNNGEIKNQELKNALENNHPADKVLIPQ